MRRFIFLLVSFSVFITKLQAQVTIGSGYEPNQNAFLDLKQEYDGEKSTKGLLLPRVDLVSIYDFAPLSAHVNGMVVYNTATSESADITGLNTHVSPGFYYNDGVKWERLYMGYTNWFYMPSIAISTGTVSTDWEYINLYDRYIEEFTGANPTTSKASNNAPPVIPHIPKADDLYYYITYYPDEIFVIDEISSEGLMKYKVKGNATAYSYVNIVFVLK